MKIGVANYFGYRYPISWEWTCGFFRNFLVKKGTFHFTNSAFEMEDFDESRGDGQNTLEEYLCLFSCSNKNNLHVSGYTCDFWTFFVESYLKTWNYQLAIDHKLSHFEKVSSWISPIFRCDLFVWVVVSNIFYFHPEPWGTDPIWRAYFSNGLVQPEFNHQLVVSRKVK